MMTTSYMILSKIWVAAEEQIFPFILLAAPCKNILGLCVVEVSQPRGMNLEFTICLVDKWELPVLPAKTGLCRVQLQVKLTWQTDLEHSDCWETQIGGRVKGEADKWSQEGHIKGILFKIGHLWICRSYCISVFTNELLTEIQLIWETKENNMS